MVLRKIGKTPTPTTKIEESLKVTAKDYNYLAEQIDETNEAFEAVVPSAGTAKADTVSEYTSGSGVNIDSVLMKDGGITHNTLIAHRVPYIPLAAQQAILFGDATRAVEVKSYFTTVTANTGAVVATMAAGSTLGQMKKIYMTACGGGGSLVLTIAAGAFVGYNTWTFDAVGDYVVFVNGTSGWYPVEIVGAVGSTV